MIHVALNTMTRTRTHGSGWGGEAGVGGDAHCECDFCSVLSTCSLSNDFVSLRKRMARNTDAQSRTKEKVSKIVLADRDEVHTSPLFFVC